MFLTLLYKDLVSMNKYIRVDEVNDVLKEYALKKDINKCREKMI